MEIVLISYQGNTLLHLHNKGFLSSMWMEQLGENWGPTGVGGVLCNHTGKPLVIFLKSIGRRESNEAKLFSIRKALTIWISLGLGKLVIESNSANAVKWVSGVKKPPWN